jgi:hypothetical protein
MKNIYLLPTGESRLSLNRSYRDFNVGTEAGEPYWIYSDYKHFHSVTDSSVRPQHMYITNDEQIKEGDWCHTIGTSLFNEQIGKVTKQVIADNGKYGVVFKKIILTTDPKQIDDEFLEWFVKNPSCDKVVVDEYNTFGVDNWMYLITIPKEDLIPPTKTTEDIKLIGEEPTITITLNKEEARRLLTCIMRTSAKGKDLDIGEMVEDKLVEFLNS